jgi:hypothetical protein
VPSDRTPDRRVPPVSSRPRDSACVPRAGAKNAPINFASLESMTAQVMRKAACQIDAWHNRAGCYPSGCHDNNQYNSLMPKEPKCQEFIYVDWFDLNNPNKMPHSEWGELKCNGRCDDQSQCKPHFEEFELPGDGLVKKEWCACPESPKEPGHCHGVRETYRSGGKLIVRFNCHGECPAKETDGCEEVHRQVDDSPPGVDRRYIVTCECLERKPAPPEK